MYAHSLLRPVTGGCGRGPPARRSPARRNPSSQTWPQSRRYPQPGVATSQTQARFSATGRHRSGAVLPPQREEIYEKRVRFQGCFLSLHKIIMKVLSGLCHDSDGSLGLRERRESRKRKCILLVTKTAPKKCVRFLATFAFPRNPFIRRSDPSPKYDPEPTQGLG